MPEGLFYVHSKIIRITQKDIDDEILAMRAGR